MKPNFPPKLHTKQEILRQKIQSTVQFLGRWLYQNRTSGISLSTASKPDPITVVCLSDTHTRQPVLPDGDILLHAGDLSNTGSFQEIQQQLDWLQSQPHRYKVIIAGNHDLLLDPEFVDSFPHRIFERPGASRADLRWGKIIYLNNSSVKLDFANGRSLNIYGSPLTSQYGTWAFQYPPIRDVWSNTVPVETDIVLTHGPPTGHLDAGGSGSNFLLKEIGRVRPRLVVFGHIHKGYGKEIVRFDSMQKAYEGVRIGEGGIAAVVWMGFLVLMQYLIDLFPSWNLKDIQTTTLVNAAAPVGPAITVEI